MPKFEVTTKSARSVWKTPDGQREIFELELDVAGEPATAKTYSKEISGIGWTGEVETYEKEGRNGLETFVKQPAKEGGYGGNSKGYAPRDDSHIKAQWAIGQAVVLHNHINTGTVPELDTIEALATDLFAMVDRVKANSQTEVPEKPDVVIEEIPDNQLTMADIDKVFPKTEAVEEEKPWPNKK